MFNHQLWRRLIIVASGLLLGSLVLGGFLMSNSTSTHAATQAVTHAASGQCSDATLKGMYVFAEQGYQIQGREQVPFAQAGNEVYDGNGHAQGIVSLNVSGQVTRLAHYTATYTVHPDCTATEKDTIPGGTLHFDEFITHNGSLFTVVETDPGVVVSGLETRGTGQ